MKFLTILLSLSLSSVFASNNLSHIASILKQVESLGDTKAVGDGGKAYGVLQIHKVCVDDINRYYNTNYTHQDAFDESCAEEMFSLYIGMGIELYKSKHGVEPSEESIVRFWNGGIYSGHKRQTTIKYYKRYLKFKKKFNLKTIEYERSSRVVSDSSSCLGLLDDLCVVEKT